MIKMVMSGLNFPPFLRRISSSSHTIEKTDLIRQSMKWNQSRNESLTDKALSLIFGERKYTEFTSEEKKIVDFYQQKKLEEDGVILPNTGAALEQAEGEQILLEHERYKEHR